MTPAIVRFKAKVRRNHRGCWIWQGGDNGKGYGRFKFMGRLVQATHFSYEYFVGEIPQGMELDHTCRDVRCVCPRHLEPVTHKENLNRAPCQVSTINTRKTHCPQGHEYSGRNSRGHRICHRCMAEADRRSRSRCP